MASLRNFYVRIMVGSCILASAACKPRDTKNSAAKEYDANHLQFGSGYKSWAGEGTASCFNLKRLNHNYEIDNDGKVVFETAGDDKTISARPPTRTQTNIVSYSLTKISSALDLGSKMDLSINAKLKLGGVLGKAGIDGGGSIGVKNIKKNSFKNGYTNYLLKLDVETFVESIDPLRTDWDDEFLKINKVPEEKRLAASGEFIQDLISTCGDKFLKSKKYGGRLYAVLSEKDSSTKRSSALEVSHDVSMTTKIGAEGGTDGKSKFESTLKDFSDNVEITIDAAGLPVSLDASKVLKCEIPTNKQELESFIKCFPSLVSAEETLIDVMYVDYTSYFPFKLDRNLKNKFAKNQFVLPTVADNMIMLQELEDSINNSAVKKDKELLYKVLDFKKLVQESFDACYTQFADEKSCNLGNYLEYQKEAYSSIKDLYESKLVAKQSALEAKPPKPEFQKTFQTPNLCVLTKPEIKWTTQSDPKKRSDEKRLDEVNHIRSHGVAATPSMCSVAGCAGIIVSDCLCSHCAQSVQNLAQWGGGLNFCRDQTDCIPEAACVARNIKQALLNPDYKDKLKGDKVFGVCVMKSDLSQ